MYDILYPCLNPAGAVALVYVADGLAQAKDYAVLARVEDRSLIISVMDKIVESCSESQFFLFKQPDPEDDYFIRPNANLFSVRNSGFFYNKPFEFGPMKKLFTCQDHGDHGTAYCAVCKAIFNWDVTIEEGLDWDEEKQSLVLVCPDKHFDRG